MSGFLVWTHDGVLLYVARDIDEAEAYVAERLRAHPTWRHRIQRLEDGYPVDD